MKANYCTTKSQVGQIARQEVAKIEHQIRVETMVQAVAAVMYVLDKNYGWKGRRLTEFIDNVNDMTEYMDNAGLKGDKGFNAYDCVIYLKKHYGIDVERKLKIRVVSE